MPDQLDYSLLDQPQILRFIFYPRADWTPPPRGASDHLVPVAQGVSISCRFYPASAGSPCILYFHGNGEVACDYDGIAPLYNLEGISLFVADYRGYGRSGGWPTFADMSADAHPIFHYFVNTVRSLDHTGPLFLMGRSLGAHSTLELASHYSEQLSGLIVESGSANMARLLRFLSSPVDPDRLRRLEEAVAAKVRSITLPLLIIHGELDELIPPSHAYYLFENVGSEAKQLVIIPGAGHNDIMLVGIEQYFLAIREFVFR